jgi:hypothetical protein
MKRWHGENPGRPAVGLFLASRSGLGGNLHADLRLS